MGWSSLAEPSFVGRFQVPNPLPYPLVQCSGCHIVCQHVMHSLPCQRRQSAGAVHVVNTPSSIEADCLQSPVSEGRKVCETGAET